MQQRDLLFRASPFFDQRQQFRVVHCPVRAFACVLLADNRPRRLKQFFRFILGRLIFRLRLRLGVPVRAGGAGIVGFFFQRFAVSPDKIRAGGFARTARDFRRR